MSRKDRFARPLPLKRWVDELVRPSTTAALDEAFAHQRDTLPVLWLLGKTGAGKSTIVQRLTGDTKASIGNGFAPCTQTASFYDHPATAPVVRFLDTRGLGETDYDPGEDLAYCRARSHAVLIITRVDDTSQSDVIQALQGLRQPAELPVIHVHTTLQAIPDASARERAMRINHEQISAALARPLTEVAVDFPDDTDPALDTGLDTLRSAIVELVPDLHEALSRRLARDAEHAAFLLHRREVLGYASAAAAVDAMPAIGIVGVPSLQGKLLHTLAGRYAQPWTAAQGRDFIAALGAAFLYRYGLSYLGRQAAKFLPVYGQTLGAATAAGISFASTYALGRTACLYLFKRSQGAAVDRETLRATFREAFNEHAPKRQKT